MPVPYGLFKFETARRSRMMSFYTRQLFAVSVLSVGNGRDRSLRNNDHPRQFARHRLFWLLEIIKERRGAINHAPIIKYVLPCCSK